jgi:hypothetical protein
MPKTRVFVDTNAIFPCMSAGEWNRLCGYYAVETVETIVDETQRGDVGRRGYVVVDEKALRNTLTKVHETTKQDQAQFQERLKTIKLSIEIDAGERDLLAYILAHEKPSANNLILTTSDRAAIRACCALDWGDCLVSLEHLLRTAGSPPKALASLKEFHRETWLGGVRTGFRLGLVK